MYTIRKHRKKAFITTVWLITIWVNFGFAQEIEPQLIRNNNGAYFFQGDFLRPLIYGQQRSTSRSRWGLHNIVIVPLQFEGNHPHVPKGHENLQSYYDKQSNGTIIPSIEVITPLKVNRSEPQNSLQYESFARDQIFNRQWRWENFRQSVREHLNKNNASDFDTIMFFSNQTQGGIGTAAWLWWYPWSAEHIDNMWNRTLSRIGKGDERVRIHEFWHNLGMSHAAWDCNSEIWNGCSDNEYGNLYDIMWKGHYALDLNPYAKSKILNRPNVHEKEIEKLGKYTIEKSDSNKNPNYAQINFLSKKYFIEYKKRFGILLHHNDYTSRYGRSSNSFLIDTNVGRDGQALPKWRKYNIENNIYIKNIWNGEFLLCEEGEEWCENDCKTRDLEADKIIVNRGTIGAGVCKTNESETIQNRIYARMERINKNWNIVKNLLFRVDSTNFNKTPEGWRSCINDVIYRNNNENTFKDLDDLIEEWPIVIRTIRNQEENRIKIEECDEKNNKLEIKVCWKDQSENYIIIESGQTCPGEQISTNECAPDTTLPIITCTEKTAQPKPTESAIYTVNQLSNSTDNCSIENSWLNNNESTTSLEVSCESENIIKFSAHTKDRSGNKESCNWTIIVDKTWCEVQNTSCSDTNECSENHGDCWTLWCNLETCKCNTEVLICVAEQSFGTTCQSIANISTEKIKRDNTQAEIIDSDNPITCIAPSNTLPPAQVTLKIKHEWNEIYSQTSTSTEWSWPFPFQNIQFQEKPDALTFECLFDNNTQVTGLCSETIEQETHQAPACESIQPEQIDYTYQNDTLMLTEVTCNRKDENKPETVRIEISIDDNPILTTNSHTIAETETSHTRNSIGFDNTNNIIIDGTEIQISCLFSPETTTILPACSQTITYEEEQEDQCETITEIQATYTENKVNITSITCKATSWASVSNSIDDQVIVANNEGNATFTINKTLETPETITCSVEWEIWWCSETITFCGDGETQWQQSSEWYYFPETGTEECDPNKPDEKDRCNNLCKKISECKNILTNPSKLDFIEQTSTDNEYIIENISCKANTDWDIPWKVKLLISYKGDIKKEIDAPIPVSDYIINFGDISIAKAEINKTDENRFFDIQCLFDDEIIERETNKVLPNTCQTQIPIIGEQVCENTSLDREITYTDNNEKQIQINELSCTGKGKEFYIQIRKGVPGDAPIHAEFHGINPNTNWGNSRTFTPQEIETLAPLSDNNYNITCTIGWTFGESHATVIVDENDACIDDIFPCVDPTEFVIVIDKSESMKDSMDGKFINPGDTKKSRMQVLKETLNVFVQKVIENNPEHRIALVPYATRAEKIVIDEKHFSSDIWKLQAAINNIQVSDISTNQQTNTPHGVSLANEILKQKRNDGDAYNNREIIIITDGAITRECDDTSNTECWNVRECDEQGSNCQQNIKNEIEKSLDEEKAKTSVIGLIPNNENEELKGTMTERLQWSNAGNFSAAGSAEWFIETLLSKLNNICVEAAYCQALKVDYRDATNNTNDNSGIIIENITCDGKGTGDYIISINGEETTLAWEEIEWKIDNNGKLSIDKTELDGLWIKTNLIDGQTHSISCSVGWLAPLNCRKNLTFCGDGTHQEENGLGENESCDDGDSSNEDDQCDKYCIEEQEEIIECTDMVIGSVSYHEIKEGEADQENIYLSNIICEWSSDGKFKLVIKNNSEPTETIRVEAINEESSLYTFFPETEEPLKLPNTTTYSVECLLDEKRKEDRCKQDILYCGDGIQQENTAQTPPYYQPNTNPLANGETCDFNATWTDENCTPWCVIEEETSCQTLHITPHLVIDNTLSHEDTEHEYINFENGAISCLASKEWGEIEIRIYTEEEDIIESETTQEGRTFDEVQNAIIITGKNDALTVPNERVRLPSLKHGKAYRVACLVDGKENETDCNKNIHYCGDGIINKQTVNINSTYISSPQLSPSHEHCDGGSDDDSRDSQNCTRLCEEKKDEATCTSLVLADIIDREDDITLGKINCNGQGTGTYKIEIRENRSNEVIRTSEKIITEYEPYIIEEDIPILANGSSYNVSCTLENKAVETGDCQKNIYFCGDGEEKQEPYYSTTTHDNEECEYNIETWSFSESCTASCQTKEITPICRSLTAVEAENTENNLLINSITCHGITKDKDQEYIIYAVAGPLATLEGAIQIGSAKPTIENYNEENGKWFIKRSPDSSYSLEHGTPYTIFCHIEGSNLKQECQQILNYCGDQETNYGENKYIRIEWQQTGEDCDSNSDSCDNMCQSDTLECPTLVIEPRTGNTPHTTTLEPENIIPLDKRGINPATNQSYTIFDRITSIDRWDGNIQEPVLSVEDLTHTYNTAGEFSIKIYLKDPQTEEGDGERELLSCEWTVLVEDGEGCLHNIVLQGEEQNEEIIIDYVSYKEKGEDEYRMVRSEKNDGDYINISNDTQRDIFLAQLKALPMINAASFNNGILEIYDGEGSFQIGRRISERTIDMSLSQNCAECEEVEVIVGKANTSWVILESISCDGKGKGEVIVTLSDNKNNEWKRKRTAELNNQKIVIEKEAIEETTGELDSAAQYFVSCSYAWETSDECKRNINYCGDNIVGNHNETNPPNVYVPPSNEEGYEENCDDGNDVDNDECNNICQPQSCEQECEYTTEIVLAGDRKDQITIADENNKISIPSLCKTSSACGEQDTEENEGETVNTEIELTCSNSFTIPKDAHSLDLFLSYTNNQWEQTSNTRFGINNTSKNDIETQINNIISALGADQTEYKRTLEEINNERIFTFYNKNTNNTNRLGLDKDSDSKYRKDERDKKIELTSMCEGEGKISCQEAICDDQNINATKTIIITIVDPETNEINYNSINIEDLNIETRDDNEGTQDHTTTCTTACECKGIAVERDIQQNDDASNMTGVITALSCTWSGPWNYSITVSDGTNTAVLFDYTFTKNKEYSIPLTGDRPDPFQIDITSPPYNLAKNKKYTTKCIVNIETQECTHEENYCGDGEVDADGKDNESDTDDDEECDPNEAITRPSWQTCNAQCKLEENTCNKPEIEREPIIIEWATDQTDKIVIQIDPDSIECQWSWSGELIFSIINQDDPSDIILSWSKSCSADEDCIINQSDLTPPNDERQLPAGKIYKAICIMEGAENNDQCTSAITYCWDGDNNEWADGYSTWPDQSDTEDCDEWAANGTSESCRLDCSVPTCEETCDRTLDGNMDEASVSIEAWADQWFIEWICSSKSPSEGENACNKCNNNTTKRPFKVFHNIRLENLSTGASIKSINFGVANGDNITTFQAEFPESIVLEDNGWETFIGEINNALSSNILAWKNYEANIEQEWNSLILSFANKHQPNNERIGFAKGISNIIYSNNNEEQTTNDIMLSHTAKTIRCSDYTRCSNSDLWALRIAYSVNTLLDEDQTDLNKIEIVENPDIQKDENNEDNVIEWTCTELCECIEVKGEREHTETEENGNVNWPILQLPLSCKGYGAGTYTIKIQQTANGETWTDMADYSRSQEFNEDKINEQVVNEHNGETSIELEPWFSYRTQCIVNENTPPPSQCEDPFEYCGDGIINGEEECDNGEKNGSGEEQDGTICNHQCEEDPNECLTLKSPMSWKMSWLIWSSDYTRWKHL